MPERDDYASEIARIKERIDSDPDPNALFKATENLREEDFTLLGKFIQAYCVADLHARRVVDALRHAALGANERFASRLQDAQVFSKLFEIAAKLPPSDIKDGLIKAAQTVELHRIHRHNFAHWAVRRVVGHNVLIMFTKNARESERRDGEVLQPDELKYGLVPIEPLIEELDKLEGHAKYFDEATFYIEKNLEAYKAFFVKNPIS